MATSYTGSSIVDYLKSVGQDTSFGSRTKLASEKGIQNYTGTAGQNTQLLNMLRGGGGTAPAPTATPKTTPISTPPAQTSAGGEPRTAQDLIAKGFYGYAGWGDAAAIQDFQKTQGAGKGSALNTTLDQYQTSLYQAETAPEVKNISTLALKAPTADELKATLAPSTPAPTPINRVALLEQQRATYGVVDLETELNAIKTDENTIMADLRATTGAEEGKPVALGVMSGRISEEQRQAQIKLDYLNVRKATLVDELNTKYNAINTFINYAGLDYQDAQKAYETEFAQNVKVQNLLSGFRQEAWTYATDAIKLNETIKQNNIDNARANLTTITNAITSGNVTYANLPADSKLQIQKLEIQSGLPVGTISSMQLSAKDKILGWSDDKTQAMVSDGNGGLKLISTGFKKSGGTTETANEYKIRATEDAKAGVTLSQMLQIYVPPLSADEVYSLYNINSSYGPATESPEALGKLGIKTISNKESL